MRILFFAHLLSVTGRTELELPDGELDTDALWRRLEGLHPGLARFRGSLRLARNSEFVGSDTRFAAGDEVALIPPVSGG